MSATAAETITVHTLGTFKFQEPDLSIRPKDRGLFVLPAAKAVSLEVLQLHDYRKAKHLKRGASGLSEHGFTVVDHKSALHGDNWFSESNLERTYYPEVQSLVSSLTGAHKVFITNVVFRRRTDEEPLDSTKYMKRDDEAELEPTPERRTTKPLLVGFDAARALEPAHTIHCDLSDEGTRSMLRHYRRDITDAAREVIRAEDECLAAGRAYDGPRYACYSVWRPVKPVRRDPLAVADARTVSRADFVPTEYRQPGVDGAFTTESYIIRPSETTRCQDWYWLPDQRDDEVLVVRLTDTETAREGPRGAPGTPHGSPKLDGTEDEEPRESVEARVIAFW